MTSIRQSGVRLGVLACLTVAVGAGVAKASLGEPSGVTPPISDPASGPKIADEEATSSASEDRMVRAIDVVSERNTVSDSSGLQHFAVDVWLDTTDESPLYCFAHEASRSGGCRTDGEPLINGLLPVLLVPDRSGVLLLLDQGVASATAIARPSGSEHPVEVVDVGLESGRRLAAVAWPADAQTVEIATFDEAGALIAVVPAE